MAITADMVKQLREKTGAGMMDCKQALAAANGDFDRAIDELRKMGLKDIAKKADKVAAEGTIGVYVHPGDRVLAFVELNCQTDFVARGEEFKQVAKDIALHVAAMKPLYVSMEEIPTEVVAKEREIALAQLDEKQKAKADMIIPGKLDKIFAEQVLLKQVFVKDDSGKQTIDDLVKALSVKTGEKVQVRRFSRIEVGEGIEKKVTDFAAEVAATVEAA